jgi:predicted O-linked N-acetylglucosamine transferase (SPINDLY family)
MASADTLLKQARRALASGRGAAASSFAEQALGKKLDARHGEALFDLGNLFADRDDLAIARALFERALVLFPGHSRLLVNLGIVFERSGDMERAERVFREVLTREPSDIPALGNLAHLLFVQERFADALPIYERIVATAPEAPAEIWNNLGVCQKHGRDQRTEGSFRRALELAPDSPQVLANLGFLLTGQRRYEQARPLLERAHALDPGRLQVAAQCVDLRLHFADWTNFERERAGIIDALALEHGAGQTVVPFAFLAICDDPALQLAAARSFAWPELARPSRPLPDGGTAAGRRIRLGFAAAAFHDHPASRLIAELVDRLDHDRFETVAYELDGSMPDATRERIKRSMGSYAELGSMTSAVAVDRIRRDGIDMLFDLMGHTAGARPDVFAAHAAPIQINYLGYAGTLGASYYDYAISDAVATPVSEQIHFTEKLVLLDGCYLPSDSQRAIADPVTRADYALPASAFVFVSQAAPYKLLPEMFDVWMQLLREIDDAVLWLRPMHEQARSNLGSEARARGVAPTRLVFAPQEPVPRYLSRFRLADLYLDTYPFGSHTTVNDALFAGLPVVTLCGRSMAARASASQLRGVGLPELIADSHEAYAVKALGLARERGRLDEMTTRLRERVHASSLFDMSAYVRRFEETLQRIWREH